MNFNPLVGEAASARILTLLSAAASPASVGSSRSEQPDPTTKSQQPPGLAASAWPIVVAIAAALCVMAAVSAWDKKHKG